MNTNKKTDKRRADNGKSIIISVSVLLLAVILILVLFLVGIGGTGKSLAEIWEGNTTLFILLIIVIVLAIIAWIWMFRSVTRNNKEAERMNRDMNALADIYEAMTLIDLKTDRMTILRTNEFHEALLENDLTNYSTRICQISKNIASDQSREVLSQFMDPSTYEMRLEHLHTISHDFLDARGFWVRFQLIVCDRDEDGRLWHIIWAVESINEERKQQNYLRKLAEMDALSQLRNRGSGEACIRKHMVGGEKGVLILIDIDDFRFVNINYGTEVGDRVIVEVAERIRESFRDSDITFRLGGDVFAAYLPGVDREEQAAERIDCLLEEIDRIALPELEEKKVSVSIGTAFYPAGTDDSYEALYKRAEQILDKNKKNRKKAAGTTH